MYYSLNNMRTEDKRKILDPISDIKILKGEDGRVEVFSPYNPLFVERIKAIEGRRHAEGKYWSFPVTDGALQKILGHKSSKTTEIYTHVSVKNIGAIKSPLDNLKIGGDHD
jgi:integrase